MIDILVPVLGRPQNAAPLVESVQNHTTVDWTLTFICSPADMAQVEACESTGHPTWVMSWPAGRGDYAKKINHGIHVTEGEWVLMIGDDVRFEPNWDTHALRSAGEKYDVVATNDLANAQVRRGEFGTHCLIRRRYITEVGGTVDGGPGTLLHEGYDHNFVDRELCGTAQQRGVYVYSRHARLKHYHYLWKTALEDHTYRKGQKHFREDQQLFWSRAHLWDYVGLSDAERKVAP